jgi:hypothetical protein
MNRLRPKRTPYAQRVIGNGEPESIGVERELEEFDEIGVDVEEIDKARQKDQHDKWDD